MIPVSVVSEVGPAVTHDCLVHVADATLGYGGSTVLHSVSLSIRARELWFFVGPNGSGKSTLLKAILGIHAPRGGTVDLHPTLERQRGLGFVPQRCDLKPTLPMTVDEFVHLGLVRTGVRGRAAADRVGWALERVGLQDLRWRDYWSLSGGQRQRALIARGLVRKPRLLILDEPTNGLDITAEESLTRLVRELHGELHISVIFVTHVIALAFRNATHAALFGGGHVLVGRSEEVLEPAKLEAAYGAPAAVFSRVQDTPSGAS